MGKLNPVQLAKKGIHSAYSRGKEPSKKHLELLEQAEPQWLKETLEKKEQQKTQAKLSQPFPSLDLGSPNNPNPVKPSEPDLGSNHLTEEKIRLSKKGKEYQEFVEKRLGPFIVIILYFFVFRGDEEKAEFYAPTRKECAELAPHVARIAPKIEEWLHVSQKVHDLIVTSDDSFSLLLITVGYLKRTGLLGNMIPGFAGRIYRKTEESNGLDIQQDAGTNGATSNGHQPVSPEQWAVYGIGAQYQ